MKHAIEFNPAKSGEQMRKSFQGKNWNEILGSLINIHVYQNEKKKKKEKNPFFVRVRIRLCKSHHSFSLDIAAIESGMHHHTIDNKQQFCN